MNALEFDNLSIELQKLAPEIPLQWGKIQNNSTDKKVHLFRCKTLSSLEAEIDSLNLEDKNYFRRRWFLWQCSRCDEYLFYINDEVTRNPNSKDQNYDIEFYNNLDLRFDVKGTLVPKELRSNFSLQHPEKIVNFYYSKQSTGKRSHLQNRLFIVHHSFREAKRALELRCAWDYKRIVYRALIHRLKTNKKFISYLNVSAIVVFVIEKQDGSLCYSIA
ncbi:hypothetical protein M4I21_07070 [Cellulophaga sp. 20_2_10]|uniref:hypothetical protein n=1 Tax=Cellulophaga sp. 20_2_10 TaxID=2942476 RepID=UPI00201A7ECE|nr:hypothetical protein [Cellulophaga sp. 20_2_10]MCL5245562.1 hypothetical protein [Cellulophaga sp. 20_2_10]